MTIRMSREFSAILSTFLLANGSGILHAENSVGTNPPVAVGQWLISLDRDESGQFVDCSARAIAADSQSGIDISILANANVWVTLTDASWQFPKGKIPVHLRIDDYDLGTRTMNPIDGQSGLIDLGNLGSDRNTQLAIEAGLKLEVFIGSDVKTFSLKDVDKAFGELTKCAVTGAGPPRR
jgi:hypothetical protein